MINQAENHQPKPELKIHTSEDEQRNTQTRELLCEVFQDDRPIDTGKTEYCPNCQQEKRVMKHKNSKAYGGFSHYVEPCRCDKQEEIKRNEFYKQRQRAELKKLILEFFPLEEEIKNYQITKFEKRKGTEEVLESVNAFIEDFDGLYKPKGVGLLISGTYGNGKTHLSKCILNYLRHTNIVVFIEFVKLFDKIQETYNFKDKPNNREDYYKCLIDCDLLVIDDIGVGEWKPDREKILLRIIDERKKKLKPIIFTMNPEGEKQLSGRVRDRIDEICFPVVNNATSCRAEVLQAKLNLKGG